MSELEQSKSPLNFLRNGDYALAIALFAVVIVRFCRFQKSYWIITDDQYRIFDTGDVGDCVCA